MELWIRNLLHSIQNHNCKAFYHSNRICHYNCTTSNYPPRRNHCTWWQHWFQAQCFHPTCTMYSNHFQGCQMKTWPRISLAKSNRSEYKKILRINHGVESKTMIEMIIICTMLFYIPHTPACWGERSWCWDAKIPRTQCPNSKWFQLEWLLCTDVHPLCFVQRT